MSRKVFRRASASSSSSAAEVSWVSSPYPHSLSTLAASPLSLASIIRSIRSRVSMRFSIAWMRVETAK